MQYAIPQFIDVEDRLIGPLTLKQFLFLLATGGVVMFFYSLLGLSVFFFFFAIPFGLLGIFTAFGKFNGRPVFKYFSIFFTFTSRPQVRIFKREEPNVIISVKSQKSKVKVAEKSGLDEPAESRLKKLAYLLDQKTHEEEEIISHKSAR